MAHQIDALQPEAIEQIVVVEDQVRQAIQLLEVVGFLGAGVRGRVDPSMRREVVEEAVPFLAERTVEIYDRRASCP